MNNTYLYDTNLFSRLKDGPFRDNVIRDGKVLYQRGSGISK